MLEQAFKPTDRITGNVFMSEKYPIRMLPSIFFDDMVDQAPDKNCLIEQRPAVFCKFPDFRFKWLEMVPHQQRLCQKIRKVVAPANPFNTADKSSGVPDRDDDVHIKGGRQSLR